MYAAKNMQVMRGYALTESCGSGTALLGEDALRKSARPDAPACSQMFECAVTMA
jgi:hypothetical protein